MLFVKTVFVKWVINKSGLLVIRIFSFIYENYKNFFLLNQICMTSFFTKWERSLIFFSLKKSSFLKSMLLLNFLIWWSSNWKKNIKKNNLMIFKQVFFNDFHSMLLQDLWLATTGLVWSRNRSNWVKLTTSYGQF